MTLPIERARTRTPVTWWTILGVILLPVLLGAILVAALDDPTARLENLHAAIVNDDEPVTVNDQLVPLGRQLTAGLVEGSDAVDSNIDWTISNTDDAAAGLADGTYAAVVTIPADFSAAATSPAGDNPTRATIDVATSPDALVADDAITATVTTAAAELLGQQVSATYLENVFLGFTTLHDQLGTAADGATSLADGATSAADGAAQLPSGAGQIASGAGQLAGGATTLANGLDQIETGIGSSAGGATQLAQGAAQGAATLRSDGIVPDQLSSGATTLAGGAQQTAQIADGLTAQLTALQTTACTDPASAACAQATAALGTATQALQPATAGVAAGAAELSAGIGQFDQAASADLAGRFDEISSGAGALAGGLGQLQTATGQSADGARRLSSGATELSTGASELASGAQSLSDGVAQLSSGTTELADGLHSAVAQIPTYTDDQAKNLAEVVADPVSADGESDSLFGASAVPLLAVLILWVGSIGTFVALRAVSGRALTSRAPSIALALRAWLPGAVVGALQGVLVAGVVQLAADYDAGAWFAFAAFCVLAGASFAAVNQALVALLGGAGRWVAGAVAALAVGAGIVSTVPGVLADIAGVLPTAPAYRGMLASLTSATGAGSAAAALVVWMVLSLAVTTIVVARRRTTTVRALRALPAGA